MTLRLVPVTRLLRRIAGRFGARFVPIVDMYSPAHDHPQSLESVTRWFQEAELEDIHVRPGLNGVVGTARRPVVIF
jgi:hypothetical protein